MEVILLWLDDLDDLVCAFAQIAERLRRPSLNVAFGAALVLAASEGATPPEIWWPLATSVALGGLVLWGLGSTLVLRQALTMAASGAESPPSA